MFTLRRPRKEAATGDTGGAAAGQPRGVSMRNALLGLVALPLLALVLTLGYDTHQQYKANLADALRRAASTRQLYATQTEQFLAQAERVLSALAERPDIRALDRRRCDPMLQELKRLQPAYANLLTLDARGRLVCSATEVPQGRRSGPEPHYYFDAVMRSGRFTVGKPAQGFITGRWVSTLAYPLRNEDGTISGVVGIAVDLMNYRPHLSAADIPAKAFVGLINGEGTVIARSERAEERVGKTANPKSAGPMLREREGVISAPDFEGTPRLFSFAPVAHSDWIVFVALSCCGQRPAPIASRRCYSCCHRPTALPWCRPA